MPSSRCHSSSGSRPRSRGDEPLDRLGELRLPASERRFERPERLAEAAELQRLLDVDHTAAVEQCGIRGDHRAAERVADEEGISDAGGIDDLGDVPHEGHQVVGRCAGRVAVPPEVDGDHVVVSGEAGRDRVPRPS